ncbi:16S rRNA (guanine(527)-N(7))-methyltransferase RsmG [Aeromicrobium alkaliterrae]|uniref:Ribosomal RNA small subunit methyltransferase G n=1 Tax=Aeromicrobium alkaliterrae TaxID=302168 RepID=A0ABN2K1A8_9ACTN
MAVSRETEPPAGAAELFGETWTQAQRYADLLSTWGVDRGMIGPREVPRLWDRHLLNCVVVTPRLPQGVTVADVGTGAGLPGLVWAIARPDIQMTLVEPLLRRVSFLEEVVADLGLENVVISRSRAEDQAGQFDVVTARAVAALDKLTTWCWPLVAPGGVLLAMKGRSAPEEVEAARPMLRRLGVSDVRIETYGDLAVPTTVVELTR